MKFNWEKVGVTLVLLALLTFAARSPAPAQLSTGTIIGFSTAEHFPAPHQRQMKFQLNGEKMTPGDGKMFITQPVLKSFRTNGEVALIITAPDCVYDDRRREASSSSHLRVQSGDGKFSIEGDGFLWRSETATILISNNISSSIRRPATNAATGQPKAPLIVTSKQFEFNLDTRTSIYSGDVAGKDEEMELSSGRLTISTSTNSEIGGKSFDFDRLVAEPKASISINQSNSPSRAAAADRIAYSRASETLELTGKATWKEATMSGRADHATFRKSDNSIDAIGNVAMKLPREAVGLGGFFSATTNAPPKATAKNPTLVDVFADRFQYRSNSVSSTAIAEGSVRIVDGTNTLKCDKLTVQSFKNASSNDTAIAEGHVVTQGGDKKRIRSQRAVYTKADERIVFTGSPDWKADESEGKAQQLTIHKPTGEMRATGGVEAQVTIDSKQGGLSLFPQSPSATNQTKKVIHFSGQEMLSRDRVVTLFGDAEAHQAPINGSEPRLRSEVIEARFGTNGQALQYIQARNKVNYEEGTVGITNGPNAHHQMKTMKLTATTDPKSGTLSSLLAEGGVEIRQFNNFATGAQAQYSGATKVLEITGNPILETPEFDILESSKLSWDDNKKTFEPSAPFRTKIHPAGLKSHAGKTNATDKPKP